MRYRDLEAGIFITRDPAGFVDGPNVYTYVRQNPWTFVDPLGLRAQTEEESEIFEELDDHVEDIDAGTEELRQKFTDAEQQNEHTDGISAAIERNENTARGIEKMSKEIVKNIANVEIGKPDPVGLRVTLEALEIWSDPKKGKKYDNMRAGCSTCNLFVDDVLANSGLRPPRRFGWQGVGPKGTTEWHQLVTFSIGDTEKGGSGRIGPVYARDKTTGKEMKTKNPTIGGVISYPRHVAIYAGSGLAIGSTQSMPRTGSGTKNPISIIHKTPYENQIIFNINVPKR